MALKATPPRNTRSKSNDAIQGDDAARLNAEKLQRQKDAKTEPEAPETKDAPEEKEPTATITKSQFDQLMASVQVGADAAEKLKTVEQELADAKAALEAKDAAKDEEKEAIEADADKKGEELDFVQQLFAQLGHPNPVDSAERRYNPQSLATGAKMDAATALREFEDTLKHSPRKYWGDATTGESYEHIDTVRLERFVREHPKEIRDGMEAIAKQNGLLRGKDAPTTRADLPPGYLTYLSLAVLRRQHIPGFIFAQFLKVKVDMGKGMGDTCIIPRKLYANTGTQLSDWELTPGVSIVGTSQRIGMDSVPVTLKEYGMGKNGVIEPIAIPEFIMATSQIELESALQDNLGYNYLQYQEIAAQSLWFASTKVLYNDRGVPTASAAAVQATAATALKRSGAVSHEFLIQLYAFLSSSRVPTYQNNMYGLALTDTQLANLISDLKAGNMYLNRSNLEDITNIMRNATGQESAEISGYVGSIAGFMIYASNNLSLGAVGSVGVQTETLGGVAVTTRTNFVFGRDSVGRAIGMAAQIRQATENDFQRMQRFLWKSHEAWAQLDVDAFFTGQSTRVYKLNLTDQPI